MTSRNTLKIAAVAIAAIVSGTVAQAASLQQVGTDRGGILVNLSGQKLDAPLAQQAETQNSGFINTGTDRGGVIRPVSGSVLDVPTARAAGHTSNDPYTNVGTDRGGVIFLVK